MWNNDQLLIYYKLCLIWRRNFQLKFLCVWQSSEAALAFIFSDSTTEEVNGRWWSRWKAAAALQRAPRVEWVAAAFITWPAVAFIVQLLPDWQLPAFQPFTLSEMPCFKEPHRRVGFPPRGCSKPRWCIVFSLSGNKKSIRAPITQKTTCRCDCNLTHKARNYAN